MTEGLEENLARQLLDEVKEEHNLSFWHIYLLGIEALSCIAASVSLETRDILREEVLSIFDEPATALQQSHVLEEAR